MLLRHNLLHPVVHFRLFTMPSNERLAVLEMLCIVVRFREIGEIGNLLDTQAHQRIVQPAHIRFGKVTIGIFVALCLFLIKGLRYEIELRAVFLCELGYHLQSEEIPVRDIFLTIQRVIIVLNIRCARLFHKQTNIRFVCLFDNLLIRQPVYVAYGRAMELSHNRVKSDTNGIEIVLNIHLFPQLFRYTLDRTVHLSVAFRVIEERLVAKHNTVKRIVVDIQRQTLFHKRVQVRFGGKLLALADKTVQLVLVNRAVFRHFYNFFFRPEILLGKALNTIIIQNYLVNTRL